MRKVCGIFLVLSSLVSTAALAEQTKKSILGNVQFWQRHCVTATNCELPTATSDAETISGEIVKPSTSKEVGLFEKTIEQGGLKLSLQFFWKKPDNEVSHLVYQQKIQIKVNDVWEPLAECSSYVTDQVATAFPVGSCTGFRVDGTEFNQFGAAFIKYQVR